MNLQEELSLNAQDPEIIALRQKQEAEQAARKAAEELAASISAELKRQLVENVKQGNYKQEYNKGTVTGGYHIPNNRYLKIESSSSYNRQRVETSRSYRFLIKEEHRTEYTHLRQLMDEWGTENNVEIKWGIVISYHSKSCTFEFLDYPFPCEEWKAGQPRKYPSIRLVVQAISHFPIDVSLPTDHMTEENIQDKRRKIQSRIDSLENYCKEKRGEQIAVCFPTLVLAGGCLYFLYATTWFSDSYATVSFLFSLLSGAGAFFFMKINSESGEEVCRLKEQIKEVKKELEDLGS